MNSQIAWLTAKEALERLCIRRHTFYSYVSRGRVRAKVDPDNPRKSLYSRLDVERLAQQPGAARRRALYYASANNEGAPTAPYTISAAPTDRSSDRGQPSLSMLRQPGLEEAAQWLWDAQPDVFAVQVKTAPALFVDGSANIRDFLVRSSKSDLSPLQRSQADLHREAAALICQTARKRDPLWAPKRDPFFTVFERRGA